MIVLAFDPGLNLGWATNSLSYHRGQRGVFKVDEWRVKWDAQDNLEPLNYDAEQDILARRLAAVDRFVDGQLIHTINPDLIVVERQMNRREGMPTSNEVNQDIETVLILHAGRHGACFLRVWPQTWQAWASRHQSIAFQSWEESGKPDDLSAHMMLGWALATQRVEAA